MQFVDVALAAPKAAPCIIHCPVLGNLQYGKCSQESKERWHQEWGVNCLETLSCAKDVGQFLLLGAGRRHKSSVYFHRITECCTLHMEMCLCSLSSTLSFVAVPSLDPASMAAVAPECQPSQIAFL